MSTPDPTHEDDVLSPLIRREATRHAAPAGLAGRISAELRANAVAASARAPAPAAVRPWRRWLEALVVFGAGAATAWALLGSVLLTPASERVGDEIVASHVRSLMASHLTDVASTDRHTVKPWFAGKLDYSPPVHDLAAQGFTLSGGRLDVLDGRPVAALVYREREHIINVFVWPATSGSDISTQTRQGYNIASWRQNGMQFWAVSDASGPDLQAFARTLQAHIASTPP